MRIIPLIVCSAIGILAVGCSARPSNPPSCGVPEPIALTTIRHYPLEQKSRDSAEFQLLVSGTQLASATAHICVIAGNAVVFHDSVSTAMWSPPVGDIDIDSIVRVYAPRFFEDLQVFPANPVSWGQGSPDPYGEWESDDPYAALARTIERSEGSYPDSARIEAAVHEFASRGSAMLTYRNDPEGSATFVWWPTQRTFVRLRL